MYKSHIILVATELRLRTSCRDGMQLLAICQYFFEITIQYSPKLFFCLNSKNLKHPTSVLLSIHTCKCGNVYVWSDDSVTHLMFCHQILGCTAHRFTEQESVSSITATSCAQEMSPISLSALYRHSLRTVSTMKMLV